MNGKIARKLRKLSQFKPHDKRYYHQFDNSRKGPGTVIEITKKEGAITNRAKYKYMKEMYYGRTI